jgi:hypothetical protein
MRELGGPDILTQIADSTTEERYKRKRKRKKVGRKKKETKK